MVQDYVRRIMKWGCGGYDTHMMRENSMPRSGLKGVSRVGASYEAADSQVVQVMD